ncbi:hypothetical protein V8C26DRAFT_245629 [Trichoderma gracile]
MIAVHRQKHSTQPPSCLFVFAFSSFIASFSLRYFLPLYPQLCFLTCHFYLHWPAIRTIPSYCVGRPTALHPLGQGSSDVSRVSRKDSSNTSYLDLLTRTPLPASTAHDDCGCAGSTFISIFSTHAWGSWHRYTRVEVALPGMSSAPCEHYLPKAPLRFSAATLSHSLSPRLSLRDPLYYPYSANPKPEYSYASNKKHTNPLTSPLAARRPICATDTLKHNISHPCPLPLSSFSLTMDDDFLFSFFEQESAIPRGMHDRHALRMKRIWDWGCLDNSASSQSLCKRLKYIWTQAGLTVTWFPV